MVHRTFGFDVVSDSCLVACYAESELQIHLQNPAIVFDGDDTLWETQLLYENAKARFYELLSNSGYDPQAVATKLAAIDLGNVSQWGMSPNRFPLSMRQTYECFCREADRSPEPSVVLQAEAIGSGVFTDKPQVRPDAEVVLASLSRYYRIVLFTAGDENVQLHRIGQTGLEGFFDSIRITPRKTTETWSNLLGNESLLPKQAWSIGNSLRSDITPAIALGLRAIVVAGQSWEYEQVPLDVALDHECLWRSETLHEAEQIVLEEDGWDRHNSYAAT